MLKKTACKDSGSVNKAKIVPFIPTFSGESFHTHTHTHSQTVSLPTPHTHSSFLLCKAPSNLFELKKKILLYCHHFQFQHFGYHESINPTVYTSTRTGSSCCSPLCSVLTFLSVPLSHFYIVCVTILHNIT